MSYGVQYVCHATTEVKQENTCRCSNVQKHEKSLEFGDVFTQNYKAYRKL